MGYYLNPNELTSMFAVPASISDKHLKLASGEQLKVLLWSIKHNEYNTDIIQSALKLDKVSVEEDLDFWVERGVLSNTSNIQSDNAKQEKRIAVRSSASKPNRSEVAKRGLECPELAFVLRESEKKFGRVLRQNESSTLVWLFDEQGLSASLILMIVGYAVEEGFPNINFIERTAVDWVNNGITDIETAEQRLVDMRRKGTAWHIVETSWGIEKRSPSKSELEMADTWINEWHYSRDMLREAYEICVNTTSKFSIPYIKKIILQWHKSGVENIDDIKNLNESAKLKEDSSDEYTDFVNQLIMKNEED